MQIAEVAKRYGITVDTIRYYERIGLVPHVTRLPNGIRDFTEYDCGWLRQMHPQKRAAHPLHRDGYADRRRGADLSELH